MTAKWYIGACYVVSGDTRKQVDKEYIESLGSVYYRPQVKECREDISWL